MFDKMDKWERALVILLACLIIGAVGMGASLLL